MRRALVLLLLLAVMLALSLLKAEAPSAGDPLTLAAIGFVVLAAFTVAEIGGALSLPQVTGYIVAGVVLGPGVSNVLSTTVVGEMRMFNTLALGLIALGAGLELDAGAIAKLARTLGATIAVKVVLGLLLVGGAVYAYESLMHPLGLANASQVGAVALVLATLSVGTSPSISLAVMKETRAKGRLMDLILGAAVLKDLVVVVSLAIAVAIAKTLLAPDAALDSAVLVHVGKELGASVLAGALLGGLLILYIRFIRAEMLLFVAGVILIVAEGARALHLELLLVFIAAGFVVRTFSKYEHDLMDAISMVSLPVFIVFFTIAGASVDLVTTWPLLPLALVAFVARAVTYYVASRVGAAAGGEEALIGRIAWLGYLPQAGVTLGLVGLAAESVPAIAESIRTTGMAVVAVNLLVGPITMRKALRMAGEIPADAAPATATAADDVVQPSDRSDERLLALHPTLRARINATSKSLQGRLVEFVQAEVGPWTERVVDAATEALGSTDALLTHAQSPGADTLRRRGELVSDLFTDVRARLREIPLLDPVPYESRQLEFSDEDGFAVRWRKRWLRVRNRFGGVNRGVPSRRICRRVFEPRVAQYCAQIITGWVRFEAASLEELKRVALNQLDAEEAADNIRRRAATWLESLESDATATMTNAALGAADFMDTVGGPAVPVSSVRLSDVARDIEDAVARWTAADAWAKHIVVARGELELALSVDTTRRTSLRAFDEHVLSAVAPAAEEGVRIVSALTSELTQLQTVLDRGNPDEVAGVKDALHQLAGGGAEQHGEQVFATFRSRLSFHKLAIALRGLVDTLPEDWQQISATTPLSAATDPDKVETHTQSPRTEAKNALELWLPTIDDQLGEISGMLASLPTRCRDVISLTLEVAEARLDLETEHVPEEMTRALEQLVATQTELPELVADLDQRGKADLQRILGAEGAGVGTGRGIVRAGGVVARLRRRAAAMWRVIRKRGADLFDRWFEGGEPDGPEVLRTAADIRLAMEERTSPAGVPPAYARLFRQAPLRDHRWFAGRDRDLARILETEATWLDGGPSSLLLSGDRGSGKTTLLNLAELQLATPRVVQPTRTRWLSKASLIQCLSYELGCKNTLKSVRHHIATERTVVLLDDLEHWFTVDEGGMRGLEQLLTMIVETRSNVFWIASISDGAAEVLEEVLAVSESFGSELHLEPLSGAAIGQLIEARHRASGRALSFPRTVMGRALGRFTGTGDRDIFFGLLGRVCGGRVGHALALWLQVIQIDETSGDLNADLRQLVAAGTPLRFDMAAEPRAMLERLLRYGPVDGEALRGELQLSDTKLARYLRFLTDAGFIAVNNVGQVHVRAETMFAFIRGFRQHGGAS